MERSRTESSQTPPPSDPQGEISDDALAALPEHPRGTLAILFIYAALFVLGWIAFYVFIFLARGATTH